MGANFSSEPVVEKDTERDQNDTFTVAVSSCQGWRMSQEDNHSLILDLPGEHKASFFAVYDGHGSARVSKHASEGLWRHLTENESYIKGDFKEALEKAFLTFDHEVNESYNAQLAGTTAICVLIVDNIIYCANIGDSRAVASINCECIPLSHDHKPENPLELKRILAAGGYVLGNRVNGNLALSRAFGDFHYKGNEQLPPEQQIVSPCPDIKRIELNDEVDFIVLACDGIWDVLTSQQVVEFVISRLEEEVEAGLICEQLTTRCIATDYELVIGCDNMTVLLVCYTRGRSWSDYCTDIFNKNTRRLNVSRTRHFNNPDMIDEGLTMPARSIHDSISPTFMTSSSTTTLATDDMPDRGLGVDGVEVTLEDRSPVSNSGDELPPTIDVPVDQEAQQVDEPIRAKDGEGQKEEQVNPKEENEIQTGAESSASNITEIHLSSPDETDQGPSNEAPADDGSAEREGSQQDDTIDIVEQQGEQQSNVIEIELSSPDQEIDDDDEESNKQQDEDQQAAAGQANEVETTQDNPDEPTEESQPADEEPDRPDSDDAGDAGGGGGGGEQEDGD